MSHIRKYLDKFWCFLIVFLSCNVLQSMISPFLNSGIQSIERQFQIPSRKSGTLISASRIGDICTVLFLAHFGSRGNRARWIGAGSMVVAIGCLLAALPNFIFPPKPVFTSVDTNFVLNAIAQPSGNFTNVSEYLNHPIIAQQIPQSLRQALDEDFKNFELNPSTVDNYFPLEETWQNITIFKNKNVSNLKTQLIYKLSKTFPSNVSLYLMKKAELPFGYCNVTIMKLKQAVKNETCRKRKLELSTNEAAYGLVFAAIIFFGIGHSMPVNLGMPLIDDNVKRKSAPFYFAAARSIRIIGPIAGLWLGAGCFKLYVTLKDTPGLSPTDPRWIGAWWLGFLIIGILLIVPSILLLFYPNVKFERKTSSVKKRKRDSIIDTVPDNRQKSVEKPLLKNSPPKERRESVTSFVEQQSITCLHEIKIFGSSILKCLKSPVYVGLLVGRLFDAFSFRGLFSFQSKFIADHYGVPLHQVSFFLGFADALSYAVGIILGSFMMRKFKLDGRRAAAYTMICSFLMVVLTASKMFLSCQSVNNAVGKLASESNFNLTSSCNENCFCDKSNLYPVCSRDGKPFFSPCHAGCTNFSLNSADSSATVFTNCECAIEGEVSRDYCTTECTVPLYVYYFVTVLTAIVQGTAGIPLMLMTLRSVPQDVRSLAMAFTSFLVNLLSQAPSTIVVGSVIDSACLLWNNVCGRQGACLLYDASALRIRVHIMYCVIKAAGLLFDVWVWYWASNLIIMKEEDTKNSKTNSKPNEIADEAV